MLTTRRDRETRPSVWDRQLRLDVLDDGQMIGRFAYDPRAERAELHLAGGSFAVEQIAGRRVEPLYKAVGRLVSRGERPATMPCLLKDAAGRTLAAAEPAKRGLLVRRAGESFAFRPPSLFSRRWQLYAEQGAQSLGSVGPKRPFSPTLQADLPRRFDVAFQVFLMVLWLSAGLEPESPATA